MVILVMYDHFHGIKLLFCPMEHKFPAVNKKCPQILLSKPVPLYYASICMCTTMSLLLYRCVPSTESEGAVHVHYHVSFVAMEGTGTRPAACQAPSLCHCKRQTLHHTSLEVNHTCPGLNYLGKQFLCLLLFTTRCYKLAIASYITCMHIAACFIVE